MQTPNSVAIRASAAIATRAPASPRFGRTTFLDPWSDRRSSFENFPETRFALLLETIEDVGRDPVVHPLPDAVDDVVIGPVLLAVEVESHGEEELGLVRLALVGNR